MKGFENGEISKWPGMGQRPRGGARSEGGRIMKKCLQGLILVLVMATHAVGSQFYTGGDLLTLLESRNVAEVNHAIGYIAGVNDSCSDAICGVPNGVNAVQLAEIVGKYLRRHPKLLQKLAADLTKMAISEAYPGTGSKI